MERFGSLSFARAGRMVLGSRLSILNGSIAGVRTPAPRQHYTIPNDASHEHAHRHSRAVLYVIGNHCGSVAEFLACCVSRASKETPHCWLNFKLSSSTIYKPRHTSVHRSNQHACQLGHAHKPESSFTSVIRPYKGLYSKQVVLWSRGEAIRMSM